MRMVLTHFDYEFSIHGLEGGLESTTWIFEPRPGDGDGRAEMREAAVAAVDLHRELLERVFAGLLKGQRTQVLSERRGGGCGADELNVASGYQYFGRMTWLGRRLLRRRLRRLFGRDADEVRRDSHSGVLRYANIGLIVGGEHGPSDLHLWVTHDLSHAVNAALFRHLRGFDAFGSDAGAASKIARLDRLLDASGTGDGHVVPIGLWDPDRDTLLPARTGERGAAPS